MTRTPEDLADTLVRFLTGTRFPDAATLEASMRRVILAALQEVANPPPPPAPPPEDRDSAWTAAWPRRHDISPPTRPEDLERAVGALLAAERAETEAARATALAERDAAWQAPWRDRAVPVPATPDDLPASLDALAQAIRAESIQSMVGIYDGLENAPATPAPTSTPTPAPTPPKTNLPEDFVDNVIPEDPELPPADTCAPGELPEDFADHLGLGDSTRAEK